MRKLALFLLLFTAMTVNAQTNWQPVYLTVSGSHELEGIEAWFAPGTCNGVSVVFIKFVNTNNQAVTLQWYPSVFTQDRTWITHSGDGDLQSLTLDASSELSGSCGGVPTLIVDLNDYGLTGSQFLRFNAYDLKIEFE